MTDLILAITVFAVSIPGFARTDYSKPGGYPSALSVPIESRTSCIEALRELPEYKGKLIPLAKDGKSFLFNDQDANRVIIYGEKGAVFLDAKKLDCSQPTNRDFSAENSLIFMVKASLNSGAHSAKQKNSIREACDLDPRLSGEGERGPDARPSKVSQ
jgi:hypothetical protein